MVMLTSAVGSHCARQTRGKRFTILSLRDMTGWDGYLAARPLASLFRMRIGGN
jgi:hypothetical protein